MSEPPRPSVVTSRSRRDALESRDDRDVALVERLAQPVRADLEDLGPGVVGVGDDPGLAAGERRRGDAEVRERHAQQRHRDPLARRSRACRAPAAGGPTRRRSARRMRSSVVLPIAETTTTTSSPPRLRAGHVVRDRADPVRVADRGPAVLLHDEGHDVQPTDSPRPRPLAPADGVRGRRIGSAPCPPRSDSVRRTGRRARLEARAQGAKRRQLLRRIIIAIVIVAGRRRIGVPAHTVVVDSTTTTTTSSSTTTTTPLRPERSRQRRRTPTPRPSPRGVPRSRRRG